MSDSLLEFPCDFPIKIVGVHTQALREHVEEVAHKLSIETLSLTERASGAGNYLAITLTVRARSQAQLDDLYLQIGASEHVKAML